MRSVLGAGALACNCLGNNVVSTLSTTIRKPSAIYISFVHVLTILLVSLFHEVSGQIVVEQATASEGTEFAFVWTYGSRDSTQVHVYIQTCMWNE